MHKNWKKKIDMLLSFVIIAILLPLFVTIIGQRMRLEELIYGETPAHAASGTKAGVEGDASAASGVKAGVEGGASAASGAKAEVEGDASAASGTEAGVEGDAPSGSGNEAGRDAEGGAEAGNILLAQPDAEAALTGIVAREIGVSAEKQAILAQCVIARTNLYDARARGTAEPEALGIEEMRELWGADFEKMYRRMEECVSLTENQVLLWNGGYIYAAYHAISAGQTRDMTEIYEKADMPYLTEQLCQQDVTSLGYLSVFYLDKKTFVEEYRRLFPECALEEIAGIEIHSRDTAGYVKEIRVGEKTVAGEEFRKRFGWNSACFSISEVDGQVRIVTKGLGHGFGLSQNTAAGMASEGADYTEILAYFYPGTELTELNTGE